jgi:hypothetical protein
MTRRCAISALLAALAAASLAACAHSGGARHPRPATAGLGAEPSSPAPSDPAATDLAGPAGGGSTTTGYPAPSRSAGPGTEILAFTATGAVCPVDPKPDAPYNRPGQVTVTWKISGGGGVDLLMDYGLWHSYSGQQGSDTLPFACPAKGKANTHKFTLNVKDHLGVTKTLSATATAEP